MKRTRYRTARWAACLLLLISALTVIPACTLFFAFVFFPAILLTGRRTGRI